VGTRVAVDGGWIATLAGVVHDLNEERIAEFAGSVDPAG
jgi:hypothetical protein